MSEKTFVLSVNLLKIKTFLSVGQEIIPEAGCGTISAFLPDKLFAPEGWYKEL